MALFTLKDFAISIDDKVIVEPANLMASLSGVVALLGPNGAGKSTLMKALAGVLPHSGEKAIDQAWPAAQDIAFMPQDYLVKSRLSALDCVLLGQRDALGWRVTSRQRQTALSALDDLGVAHLAKRAMCSLSGGQQQLVLLAQRLSRYPGLLLLDEPTSALDLHHQLDVMSHIKRYSMEHDVLAICSLHDLTLAGRYADYIFFMQQGCIISYGDTVEVLTQQVINQVYNIDADILVSRDQKPVIAPMPLTEEIFR